MEAKVQILLSTYNGEKYLLEQLNSLLQQSYSNIHILIRDDGSSDNTVNILKNYQKIFPQKIKLVLEKNIGVVNSFFKLIEISENNYDFYFFCDQDDFWEKDKIKEAVKKIKEIKEEKDKCIGYCSNLKIVDADLRFIRFAYSKALKPSLLNSFLENVITGCSYACNKNLFLKIKESIKVINNKKVLMHDYYFYILNCLYGELIYDEKSYILYRQHSNNVCGMKEKNSFLNNILKSLKNRNENKRIFFLEEIYLKYNQDFKEQEREYLKTLLDNYNKSFIERFITIKKLKFVKQNPKNEIFLKMKYLLKIFG